MSELTEEPSTVLLEVSEGRDHQLLRDPVWGSAHPCVDPRGQRSEFGENTPLGRPASPPI